MTETAQRPGRIGVIIVAYNDLELLERVVASVQANGHPDTRIIIIDNSTREGIGAAMQGREGIHYLRTPENLGFCGANNIGIGMAEALGAEFALLLNHDAVLEPGCLAALQHRAQSEPEAGIVTGKIYLFAGERKLWYAGGFFSRLIGAGKNHGFGETDRGQYDAGGEVEYATGCVMLIPMKVFARAGRLDERFFMYLDDIEFCLRVRRAGFRVIYEPQAVVRHELGSGAQLPQRPDYYLYFSIRNKPLVVAGGGYGFYLKFATLAIGLIKLAQYGIYPGIPERGNKLRALLWGLQDAFSAESRYHRRFPRLFRRG